MINPKMIGLLVAAFVAGTFVASPELRAYAANTVGSSDIINESILSEDIKNSQVKASDIAADAVGGSELIGVSKFLFGQCNLDSGEASSSIGPGLLLAVQCNISGVDSDDTAIATLSGANNCFNASQTVAGVGFVTVHLRNGCSNNQLVGSAQIGIIVFDK